MTRGMLCWQAGDKVLFYPLYHTSYETMHAVETLIDPGFKVGTVYVRSIFDTLKRILNT